MSNEHRTAKGLYLATCRSDVLPRALLEPKAVETDGTFRGGLDGLPAGHGQPGLVPRQDQSDITGAAGWCSAVARTRSLRELRGKPGWAPTTEARMGLRRKPRTRGKTRPSGRPILQQATCTDCHGTHVIMAVPVVGGQSGGEPLRERRRSRGRRRANMGSCTNPSALAFA